MPHGTNCTDTLRLVYCDSFFKIQFLNIIRMHLSSESLIFVVHLTVKCGNSPTSWKSYLSSPYIPSLYLLKPQSAQQRPDFRPKEIALNVCRNNDTPKSWILAPVTLNCFWRRRGVGGVVGEWWGCLQTCLCGAELASAQEPRRPVNGRYVERVISR